MTSTEDPNSVHPDEAKGEDVLRQVPNYTWIFLAAVFCILLIIVLLIMYLEQMGCFKCCGARTCCDLEAPNEDDDEEMIKLKRDMMALKMMNKEALQEEEAYLTKQRDSMKSEIDSKYDSEFEMMRRSTDSSICFTCGLVPRGDEILKAVDRVWHKKCWVCFECKKPLEIGAPFGADGCMIYCERDYKAKFFCAHCNEFIEDDAEETDGKLYHPKCYLDMLEQKQKAEQQKVDAKAKEDADYLEWMKEFEKTIQRGNAKAGTGPATPTPTAAPAATPPQKPAAAGTQPAQTSPPAATAATQLAAASLADKKKVLGLQPNPKTDPAAYKEYMRKKFALEQEENKLIRDRNQQLGVSLAVPVNKR